jgi:secreted trypsin-like serine protease
MLPLLVLLISLISVVQGDAGVKIVGGEAAAPGEFPYQVFVEKIWNSTKIYKCGGAVYNKDFIITAAHCLFFKDKGHFAKPHKIWITAGT